MNKSNRIFFYISRHRSWLDVALPICACFTFFSFCSVVGRKTCFVFHYFFVYRLHHTSGKRDSVVQLGESVLSIIIFTSNKAATFRVTILFRKGRYIRIKRCHKRVYIKEFVIQVFLWLKKKETIFFVYSWTECGLVLHLSVHVGRLWLRL